MKLAKVFYHGLLFFLLVLTGLEATLLLLHFQVHFYQPVIWFLAFGAIIVTTGGLSRVYLPVLRLSFIFPVLSATVIILSFYTIQDDLFFLVFLESIYVISFGVYFFTNHYSQIAKIIIAILYGMVGLALILHVLLFWAETLVPFGETKIVETIPSPNHGYIAQVIERNEGALGGNTKVIVRTNEKDVHMVFFKLKKTNSIKLYHFDPQWGRGEDMNVHWISEDLIEINDVIYDINKQ